MSNLELLQKLSLGKDYVEHVTIQTDDDETTFEMRPLTDGELTKLRIIEKEPYSMKIGVGSDGKRKSVEKNTADMNIGMGEFTEYQAKAMYTAVAWSLSVNGENVTIKDVQGLKKGIPSILFAEVIRISNLTEEDLTVIKQFRN